MIPVYVINLDRQPERWDRIKRNADDIGVTLTRVPALDRKRDYGPDLEKEFGRRRGLDHDKVSAGDICCSLSHVRRTSKTTDFPIAQKSKAGALSVGERHCAKGCGSRPRACADRCTS
ncbi:glycosyltransferase family 25 protein [Salibaculum sp.]|uniref:glycosyltransferase family 25 protein n=1 Tax=Salibaculum sp. TaxID=2855480 RepID=UPI002B48D38E|nr:glycosyltransferase family 25 protein [Salibaculum sp.]HKL69161.1 glycosyltransferase family 25 protein [Salibaculum sp.]